MSSGGGQGFCRKVTPRPAYSDSASGKPVITITGTVGLIPRSWRTKSAPLAIQRDKRAVYDGLKMDLDQTLKYAEQVSMELRRTKDHQEGATAFVEKREPVFRGE